ncbi:MAG: ABC transporter permease [Candidatus Nomurabacteria bacterium]|jgi:putative ABC transport system permease protein|nr:ABC transporter permease [Candidatus Nomurabacteria bacterium]
MKITDILKTVNANLLRNKGRSFLTILAIFIGAFTIILTNGINTGVNGYIDRQLESAGGEGYVEIYPGSMVNAMMGGDPGFGGFGGSVQEYNPDKNGTALETIDSDDLAKIRAVAGVKNADTYQQINAEYITSDKTDKKWTLSVGRMPTDTINVDMVAGKIVTPDAGQYQISLQPDYAKSLGFESDKAAIGAKVTIGVRNSTTNQIKETEAVVTGVQNKSVISMGRSWINKSLATELYKNRTEGLPEQYRNQASVATAQLDEGLSDAEIQAVKDKLKDLGYTAMTVDDQVGMLKSFFDAITTVLTIFGVIALLAASIGIVNTLFMAVQERTREIGLMKAMGLDKSEIRLMFSLEAVALGFWGSAIGVGLAFVARAVANSVATDTFLSNLPGFTLVEFDPVNLIVMVLVVMFIAFLAGSLPARRASKLDPISALRYE